LRTPSGRAAAGRQGVAAGPSGTAAISAGSAIAGAALGYFTARSQSKAELERLRYGHEQAHLSHRQAVYHDYLDAVHRFHQDAGGIEPFKTAGTLRRSRAAYVRAPCTRAQTRATSS
jgi:hypothetical protein